MGDSHIINIGLQMLNPLYVFLPPLGQTKQKSTFLPQSITEITYANCHLKVETNTNYMFSGYVVRERQYFIFLLLIEMTLRESLDIENNFIF